MKFWNLIHNSFGMHVTVFVFLILAAAMIVLAVVHHLKQTKREKNNGKELEQLRQQPEGSPAPEKQAEKPAEEAEK